MNKQKELYKILKGLGKLYVKVRANPQKEDIVNELDRYVFLLKMKANSRENAEVYYGKIKSFMYYLFKSRRFLKYNYNKAVLFLHVLIIANLVLAELISNQEYNKAGTLASSVHNLPDFLLNEYVETDAITFFDEHICLYERIYGESYLKAFKPVFFGEIVAQDEVLRIRISEMKKFYQREAINKDSYGWEIADVLYSESKNIRAFVFRKSDQCYKLGYEKLFYDEYVDAWSWVSINLQANTFVDSIERATELVREEFRVIDS